MRQIHDAEWTAWLAAQRHRALNIVLILALATGFVGLVESTTSVLRDGRILNLP